MWCNTISTLKHLGSDKCSLLFEIAWFRLESKSQCCYCSRHSNFHMRSTPWCIKDSKQQSKIRTILNYVCLNEICHKNEIIFWMISDHPNSAPQDLNILHPHKFVGETTNLASAWVSRQCMIQQSTHMSLSLSDVVKAMLLSLCAPVILSPAVPEYPPMWSR